MLLVEDIAAHAELFKLSVEGWEPPLNVEVISNGKAAMTRFESIATGKADRPDLVLLDLSLPLVSGHDLLAYIRATQPISDMPVVITTSSQDESDVVQATDLGVQGYLVKPIQFSQLQMIFGKVLGNGV